MGDGIIIIMGNGIITYVTGADPGFLKGGVHLRSTSKKRGGGPRGGPTLGPMLKSLHRDPNPDPLDPPPPLDPPLRQMAAVRSMAE